MNLAHAFFSASVVGASVLVGVLRTLDASALAVLGTVAGRRCCASRVRCS